MFEEPMKMVKQFLLLENKKIHWHDCVERNFIQHKWKPVVFNLNLDKPTGLKLFKIPKLKQ